MSTKTATCTFRSQLQIRHWIYETISTFQKILTNPKQSPTIKFNTLLGIKYCFDTCEYALVTLIQVYLLNKIMEIALFRSKVKDQTLLVTYFTTEGYKQKDHPDLKKISYNFVMLAMEFIYMASQVKKFRCVENIEIKQASRYAMCAQTLTDKGIKRPDKFSFFLPDYAKEQGKKYQTKLTEFGEQEVCEIYSEYLLGIMIAELQTGKKGPLQIRSLLSYGDAYLTSAMINLCEDELSSMPQGLENKKKYLNLFHEFVRWGDIEAVLMINNSDFITKISVNICTVRGQINVTQGQNIYPQIPGKKQQKREFYVDFLRSIETWADCIPLNEEGNESNVRRIYIFLKEEKKFKFPQNLILQRYRKELDQNMKKNEQRNQKLLQIINNSEQDEQQVVQTPKSPDPYSAKTKKPTQNQAKQSQKSQNQPQSITFTFLEDQIQQVQKALQKIVTIRPNQKQKQVQKKLSVQFEKLSQFKQQWVEWLDKIDLDSSEIHEEDQEKLQEIILDGDQTMEAIQIISPLIQMYQKNKLSLDDFLKRMKQTLDVHQDLSMSRSKQLELTKSLKKDLGKSMKKSLTHTIQKSILNQSQHKNLAASKFDASTHQQANHTALGTSMHKSRALVTNAQKSNLANSLYKSNHPSGTSSIMRRSKMHEKLHKLKENSSQIAQMVESRNANFQTIKDKPQSYLGDKNVNKVYKNSGQDSEEYFQQNKSIGIKPHHQQQQNRQQQVIKEQERSSQGSNSRRSIEKSSKSHKKQNSIRSSRNFFNNTINNSRSSELIQSPGSSRNFKSEKNITVVSKNSERIEVLQQQSKKVVEDMNISNETNNIVVEYSDIDQNEIQKKANEREQQEINKNQMKKLKKKEMEQAFMKFKVEEKKPSSKATQKVSQNTKTLQIPQSIKSPTKNQQLKSPLSNKNQLKSPTSHKNILFSSHKDIEPEKPNLKVQKQKNNSNGNGNKVGSAQQLQSSSQNIIPTKERLTDRLTPFNEDYGGKQRSTTKKYDNIETPRRSDRLEKTKKSESKISMVSDDDKAENTSMRSSKSIKDKLKSRISQRKSLIKQQSDRSLESQIRAMRVQTNSNQSRSLSRRKGGLLVTQMTQKSKLKLTSNAQYNHLPNNMPNTNIKGQMEFNDLHKTKKINESNQDFKNRTSEIEVPKNQSQEGQFRLMPTDGNNRKNVADQKSSRNIQSSSLDSRVHRQGISLSLGKRGSFITNKSRQAIINNKGSILKREEDLRRKDEERRHERKFKDQAENEDNLREEYFNNNMRKSKHSNRSRIKKRLASNRSCTQSDSSCGDIIKSPDHKPMMDSHYTTKDLEAKLTKMSGEKLEFKNYIESDLKKQIICPKTKQIEQIIKYGSKRHQIENFIQHNPNSNNRKAKSHDKHFYGSLVRDKSTEKEVSQLQSKLKALENETRNMKTKLAVRDQEVKSYKNSGEKGFVEFTTPSQSNYFASSDGFKTSRIGSEKALFSPMAHQFLKSEFQNSSLITQVKHAKSSSYKQYFEKVKGNTFKKTLLKSKSLIQKQDQIEIGCMNVRKEDFSLEITIFITPLRFDLADISYAIIHDDNLVSQCHPKKVINIELKKQQKIHIKMNIKKVPFCIPQFQLTYKSKSQYSTNYFRIPIPTLFNKFCQLEAIPLQSFENKSFPADRTIITSEFKLNTKVVKLQKIKEVLTNFSYSKSKQMHVLTSCGVYKDNSFWVILKINQRNHAIMEGVMEEGQNFKYLQFLLVTMKNILEVQQ